MSLTLTIDGERWRAHLEQFARNAPGLVPVAKGNGYGFTLPRLARRTQWLRDRGLGGDVLAVGTYDELPEVASRYAGDLLVLTPWRPFTTAASALDEAVARRVIHTVSRPEDLAGLLAQRSDARYVLELETSMRRHGMRTEQLHSLGRGGRCEGLAIHLPLAKGSHLAEVENLIAGARAAGLADRSTTIWVSHLSGDELAQLSSNHPDLTFRPRIGTALWLGERGALRVTATVLDSHPLKRGQTFGYRGRSLPREGHLLIVSGGTAHGIGLEAPRGQLGLRGRASAVARGGLDALGLTRSPFWVEGKQRFFAEPPHMQASMLFLPGDARVPAVGDLVEARVRFTTTSFDRVETV